MAQVKEQNPAQAQNNPNRNSESGGEKRTRTRRPYYNRRPRRAQQPKEAAVPIHIYPLGGLGEVGKNMTVYECNGDMIIVDCGLVFPDSEMYGVDMVIPDFTFVVQNRDKIKGLLITHGHEDHIGSIPYLLQKFDLPIYGTLRPHPEQAGGVWSGGQDQVRGDHPQTEDQAGLLYRGAHPCQPLHPRFRGLCH